jgi:hypothetical protein
VTRLIDRLRKRARAQGGARESLFQALKKAQAQRQSARQPVAGDARSQSGETPASDEGESDGEVSRTDA